MPPPDLSAAINDLCKRYSVDLAALSRQASMDWNDLATLAADPLVTVGSATVNYPVLSNLRDDAALREMTMGMAVARAAFHREIRHFAYPFGDAASWRRRHAVMAEEAGFVSAVSALPGVVEPAGRSNLFALPRISWDGRLRSLRAMRVMLVGRDAVALAVPALGRGELRSNAGAEAPPMAQSDASQTRPVVRDSMARYHAHLSGRAIQLTIGIAGSTQPIPATT